ncbi:PHP domain-containing protein [Angustibacter sp. McL0619]|uniref:PHP domain-containing protein n=1 Tax=Angustibacter sp. McL0619 TaxID=3415676 RepID=UPI003CF87D21
MLIDLHTHSAVSDGTQSPAQVVHSAAEAGLDVVALTDHDTTAGWSSAAEQAVREGVRLVPGMEISSTAEGISVHLLSYLHDPGHAGLLDVVERTRHSRLTRAERMVELLSRDVDISWDDVRDQVQDGGSVGRPHIADALVARGVVRDRTEAFAGLLSARGAYYVRHYAPDAVQAVRLVVAAGGVPVMAHPMAHLRGRVVGDEVIASMADAGLAGLEVYHRDNDGAAQAHLLDLSRELDLLVTGSSDYHGTGKPNMLAENTTEPEVLAEIEARASGTRVVG